MGPGLQPPSGCVNCDEKWGLTMCNVSSNVKMEKQFSAKKKRKKITVSVDIVFALFRMEWVDWCPNAAAAAEKTFPF